MTTSVTQGGGGFSSTTEGEATGLDHFLLYLARPRAEAAGRDRVRVCFVPTASGDGPRYVEKFEKAYEWLAETTVLSLFCMDPYGYRDPALLLEQDLVFVGGGWTTSSSPCGASTACPRCSPRPAVRAWCWPASAPG